MPIPVVAIQLEAPVEPQYVQQMLKACDTGAGQGACVLASDPNAHYARHLAYVSFLDESHQHQLIEVGERGELRGSYEFQRLKFTVDDLPSERWQAVGLTIASLARPGPSAEPRIPVLEPPQRIEEPTVRSWRGAVSARVGSGFLDKGASAGLGFSLAYDLPGVPLFPLVWGGWRTATAEGVTAEWWETGVGLGAETSLGDVRIAVSGLVVGQLLRASANRAESSDSGSSGTTGVSSALQLVWPASGPAGATLGLHVLQVARATEISSSGTVILETPATNYGASLGLEGRF